MPDAFADAFVIIKPDFTVFQAQLQAGVDKAVRNVRANVQANLAGAAGQAVGASTAANLTATGRAARKASTDLGAAASEANAARGALIGLSRVTPVTVFGLGLYGTAALAAGLAVKSAVSATADFEHQLNVFQAVTGATATQMQNVSARAKELGNDLSLPAVSAGDAALGMTELAKAGISVNDTLAASKAVLQLSAAANISVGDAANFTATQLNAFGLSGTQATHVADLLAGASAAAQGEITDFAFAFQQVSAVAKQVDLDIETATGALTELARAGLKGADGGTSLRTTLLRLAPTTKQAAEFQKALGIEINQTLPIGKQFGDLLDQYKRQLAGLTEVQQQQVLTQIVGQDAIRAFSILVRGGSKALDEATAAANKKGAADRLAQANAKGLSGAFSGLKSNAETLGITLGEVAKGPLAAFVKGLAGIVKDGTDALQVLIDLNAQLGEVKIPGTDSTVGDEFSAKNVFGAILKAEALVFTPTTEAGKAAAKAIKNARATVREEIARQDRLDQLSRDNAIGGPGAQFGISGFIKQLDPSQITTDIKTFQGAGSFGINSLDVAPKLSAAQKKAAKAIRELIAGNKKAQKDLLDTVGPQGLQEGQLDAQISGSLQAELTADRKLRDFFEARLKTVKEGTKRYLTILTALAQADSAVRSVQDQIKSQHDAQVAQDKADAKARKKERDDRIAAAKEAAKAEFELQRSRFDLAIQAAGLTPGTGDDARANRAEIRFLNRQIKRIEAIKKRRKLTTEENQEIVNLKSIILTLRGNIQGLNDAAGGGFSLADLFKESVDTFNNFGSNVSSSPQTSGQAGQSFMAAFAGAGLGKLTQADKMKLAKAAETNDLLAAILQAVSPRSGDGGSNPAMAGLGANYYKLPPGQRAMARARAQAAKVPPQ